MEFKTRVSRIDKAEFEACHYIDDTLFFSRKIPFWVVNDVSNQIERNLLPKQDFDSRLASTLEHYENEFKAYVEFLKKSIAVDSASILERCKQRKQRFSAPNVVWNKFEKAKANVTYLIDSALARNLMILAIIDCVAIHKETLRSTESSSIEEDSVE